jgi:hypothetical protein
MMTAFRENSENFNNSLTKEERLEQGIFFTPKKARDILFEKLSHLYTKPKTILEPSFGSGEFILDARRVYPKAKIIGVEKNEALFKSVKCPNSTLICADFLTWTGKADLIIGNPPYFVCKKTKGAGRPNMYILFLYKCLEEHLEKDGFLAFIIPTSLYNCSYYQPMRDYIKANTTIHYLETLDKPGFYETGQETMLIILQNKKINDDYLYVTTTGRTFISPFYKELYEIMYKVSDYISIGDNVETNIYTDQNWYLQKLHGFYTCVETSYYINKYPRKNSNTYVLNFSTDLNKTSLKNINKRNINNIQILLENKNLSDIMYLNKIINHDINNNKYSFIKKFIKSYNLNNKHIELINKIDKSLEKIKFNNKIKKQLI